MNLYEKPLEILIKLSNTAKPEMSRWQLSYLCGLIKEMNPKKLVEIAVASGGTTSVVLNCISELDIDCEVYSMDISKEYYRERNYDIGFLAEGAKKHLKKQVKHSLQIGVSPECIDQIGRNIDFLILDTVHMLPGEILDFWYVYTICLKMKLSSYMIYYFTILIIQTSTHGLYRFC